MYARDGLRHACFREPTRHGCPTSVSIVVVVVVGGRVVMVVVIVIVTVTVTLSVIVMIIVIVTSMLTLMSGLVWSETV